MTDLEQKLKNLMETAVCKAMSSPDFITINFADRLKLPPEFMREVWAMVDQKKIKKKMVARLEEELANRIVNKMAEELTTDIKQILSVKERREELRAVARENIDRLCKAV